MNVNKICICGAGTMGKGIAQTTARAGFLSILYELNPSILEKAEKDMSVELQILVDKGKLNEQEKEKTMQRIQFTNDIHSCIADLFIEAIIEKSQPKVNLFNQLAEFNHVESIFASNTSSLSINALAEQIKNPERVIGMHFFNPAPVMKLVEVVNTNHTLEKVSKTIVELVRKLGKTPVRCVDSPGFIVNRVARPYYIESLRIAESAESGISGFAQIDRLLEATGFKMGPFKLMDLIGNDINYAVSQSVFDQLGRPERLRPSSLQQQRVEAGELGRKSGKGYYEYQPQG